REDCGHVPLSRELRIGIRACCSRRPVGDATCYICIALPTEKRLQDSRARISKTAAAPAIDLPTSSCFLHHVLHAPTEKIARLGCGAYCVPSIRNKRVFRS